MKLDQFQRGLAAAERRQMKKLTPEQYAQAGTEHAEQVALFMWANDEALAGRYPNELRNLFAIPNGGLRSKATAGRLKAEGVKSGVSDIFLPVIRYEYTNMYNNENFRTYRTYHGLFIEMKTLKPVPARHTNDEFYFATPEQREFILSMRSCGYAATVCRGWIAARETILAYLHLPA